MERTSRSLGNLRNLLGVDFEGQNKGPGIISKLVRTSPLLGPGIISVPRTK